MKLWGGRFRERTSSSLEGFTESISFDKRLWRYDIIGSMSHVKMLMKQGIIPRRDGEKILKGLKRIYKDIESGRFEFRSDLEDIHMNIEHRLIELTGEAGARLHTARSRNDQVALDLRLYLRDAIKEISGLLRRFTKIIINIAEKNIDVIMPGYTHLQRAQPVLLSHHLLAYVEMFLRDIERFNENLSRVDVLPLGSCAMAGTSLPVDREFLRKELGFRKISQNSMDSVSDRDFALEFLSNSSILMMHLSRLSEEFILWSTTEFGFIELPDAFTTGSSIMPQKKNPDLFELIRGKTGRVYGNLLALLTVMKGIPLTYNRDMQEDKEPVFDTHDTLKDALSILIDVMPLIRFNRKRMYEESTRGFTLATDVAEYLVRKGVPFRKAHEITGRLVRYCIDNNKTLQSLSLNDFRKFSAKFNEDIHSILTPESSVSLKTSKGGTSPEEVKRQLRRLKKIL